jgi:hypothetical protein
MHPNSCRFFRLASVILLAATVVTSTNCSTTYDAYGNPQQSVDPGLAIAGVAAAGLVGYAIADNNNNHYHNNHHYYNRPRHHRY